jgi:perosamine synthetase
MTPLYKPYMPAELPDLDSIIHSGALAYGKYGKKFEQALSAYLGAPQVAVTNTFNAAVLVVLTTLGIRQGDEVVASPMACLASNQPLATQGANVVWADVDPMTGTLDPESVRAKITSKTKAIFHNHFCGYPGHIDEINAIGREFGVPVVDDGIEAFGSRYKGKRLGTTGADVSMFSFQAVRLPTTIDGGAVVFRDEQLHQKNILVRDCGIDRARFRDDMGEISLSCDIELPGHSATMSDVNSYIGLQQMNDIESLLARQCDNARQWTERLREQFPGYRLMNDRKEISPNYWVYGILADDKAEAIRYFRSIGYYASGVHINNSHYSVFGNKAELCGASEFYRRFVALPSGWWMQGLE